MNARLNIEVEERNGSPFLKNAFFTTPLKLADITEDKSGTELHLMLMSASPGILDGDEYDISITVAENCSVQLHTQGYQRLFQMKGCASQQFEVKIATNASFCFLPHPAVPHENSSFTSTNKFYLKENASMVFGEVLTCGRKLNGESFLFSKYHSVTSVFINDELVIKENLLMQPSVINVHAIGQLEGYTHQASMIWLQDRININEVSSTIIDLLAMEKNITSGVSKAPVSGLIIRILGHGAEQLYDCLQKINSLLPSKNQVSYAS